jgi:hypothetical protein
MTIPEHINVHWVQSKEKLTNLILDVGDYKMWSQRLYDLGHPGRGIQDYGQYGNFILSEFKDIEEDKLADFKIYKATVKISHLFEQITRSLSTYISDHKIPGLEKLRDDMHEATKDNKQLVELTLYEYIIKDLYEVVSYNYIENS